MDKVIVNYGGVRHRYFSVMGTGRNFTEYNESRTSIAETTIYKNQFLKTCWNVEPRVSIAYAYSKSASFKAAYARTQNIHLVSNATSASPTDVLLTSTLNTRPEIADQVSAGWFKTSRITDMNSIGKRISMQNQIDYRNGANAQANETGR